MKTDTLANPTVRAAIEALQRGDQVAWSTLFEPDAELYDDGVLAVSRISRTMRSATSDLPRLIASRMMDWA
jgi:hypothetical protein